MLFLIFYAGDDRYAIESSRVVEIVPRVILRKLHHAPDYVAGVFNYRGTIVPVIDLCHLIQNTPSRPYLSTRIVMVNYRGKNNIDRLLGLMAERVTETLNQLDTKVTSSGMKVDTSPYLGDMILDRSGTIQCIRLDYLLSETEQINLLPMEQKTT
ncbi:MAG: chemotaxis protein CheW [Cyanobacteria bacterium SID2]|nr:chemotaxis protein CheW [Cyanobacteria bacterium SID2]MBP0003218.1 chemotaxis protein CheW [Cyanobacteria bacterium SBC]